VTESDRVDPYEARTRLLGARDLFSVSELFHENSKIVSCAPRISQSSESILVAPNGFKRYVHVAQVSLPEPKRGEEIFSAILHRQSWREYSSAPVGVDVLSVLAFHALGVSAGHRRCLPSAGGLYPLELYVLAMNVEGLAAGVYHYDVRLHALDVLSSVDPRTALTKAIFIEEAAQTAAAAIVLSGVFGRSKIKYGERAYRFVLLEAGHAMQNLCLACTVLGLGSCPVGGFVDDHLNELLDIDGIEEAALYAMTVGLPAV
jgi:SagB-type dehydrogenase family enzyme